MGTSLFERRLVPIGSEVVYVGSKGLIFIDDVLFNPLKMTKEWGFSTFLQIGTSELSNFWN